MGNLIEELKRRRVFRTAAIYLVAGWGAVEVGSTVLPLIGTADWAPRLLLAIVAAGFPVAVLLGWRFDVGPDGIRRAEASDSRSARFGQAALIALASGVGLAIPAFILLDLGSETDGEGRGGGVETDVRPVADGRTRTVAVLPFENASRDPSDAYFAAGVTDELVGALARFEGIRVLLPAAAARLLESGTAPDEIGSRLGAGYTLQGSVRRSGETVRIAALLADDSGAVLWQDSFDPDLSVESLFDVQERVARSVADRFNAEIAPSREVFAGRVPTRDLEAFDRFLRANYDLSRRTPAAITRAIAGYRAASERDPGFVAARAREAYAYELFVDWDWAYAGASGDELLARAVELAGAALADDSTSADAWLATGYGRYLTQRTDPAPALPAMKRALELNPADPEIFHQYGQTLMMLGRYSEAASAYHSALALDPTRAMTLVPLAAMSHRSGNLPEARRWIDSAVVVGPDVPYAWSYRANVRNARGDHRGALEDAQRALEVDPSYSIPARSGIAVAEHGLGRMVASEETLDEALAQLPDPDRPGATDALYLGGALVATGRSEEALSLLERTTRGAWLWFYLQHPDFDPIRDTGRFRAVESSVDPRPPGDLVGGRAP